MIQSIFLNCETIFQNFFIEVFLISPESTIPLFGSLMYAILLSFKELNEKKLICEKLKMAIFTFEEQKNTMLANLIVIKNNSAISDGSTSISDTLYRLTTDKKMKIVNQLLKIIEINNENIKLNDFKQIVIDISKICREGTIPSWFEDN